MDPSVSASTPAATSPYLVVVSTILALIPAFLSALATWWSSVGKQARQIRTIAEAKGRVDLWISWMAAYTTAKSSDETVNKQPVIEELNAAAEMVRSVSDEARRLLEQTNKARVALAQPKVHPVRRALFLYRMPNAQSRFMRMFFYLSCPYYGWQMQKIFELYKTAAPSSFYGHGWSVALLTFLSAVSLSYIYWLAKDAVRQGQ